MVLSTANTFLNHVKPSSTSTNFSYVDANSLNDGVVKHKKSIVNFLKEKFKISRVCTKHEVSVDVMLLD